MRADWSAECGTDDPTLVVPWADPATGAHWVDLRAEPYGLADIAETEAWPELGRALRSLNGARSPLMTAKCDVWLLARDSTRDELAAVAGELDLPDDAATFGVAAYIDLLWRDRALFTSAGRQQLLLDGLVRRLERLGHTQCAVELVLRPALLDVATPLEGFAATLYLRAVDSDAASARLLWAAALDDVVTVLRMRPPSVVPGSATIDMPGRRNGRTQPHRTQPHRKQPQDSSQSAAPKPRRSSQRHST